MMEPLATELIGRWLREPAGDHAVIVMNEQGIIIEWLGAAEQILGYPRADVVGRSLSGIFTPDDLAKKQDVYELRLAAATGRSEDERWHVRRDGSRIWASGTLSAIRNHAGAVIGFVKVLRDRTDARIRLDKLHQHIEALEGKVERAGTFMHTLGHELRNPITPLSNCVSILERQVGDERLQGPIRSMRAQLRVMTQVVDDLSDAARLGLGKVRLSISIADIRGVVSVLIDAMQGQAAAAGVKLDAILPATPILASIDLPRIEQALLNVLGNALKFTPSGGAVWVTITEEGPDVVVRVRDTGIGIDPEVLPHIFELFTQDKRSGVAHQGLGIGLAMVNQIVVLHGGSVQARSAGAGKGSEFILRVPLAPDRRIK